MKTKIQLLEEKEDEIRKSEEFRTSNSKKQKEIERFNQRKLELESILKEACNQIEHLEEEREHFNEKNVLMQVLSLSISCSFLSYHFQGSIIRQGGNYQPKGAGDQGI